MNLIFQPNHTWLEVGFKKRWAPQNRDKLKKKKSYVLWMLESGNTEILFGRNRNLLTARRYQKLL